MSEYEPDHPLLYRGHQILANKGTWEVYPTTGPWSQDARLTVQPSILHCIMAIDEVLADQAVGGAR